MAVGVRSRTRHQERPPHEDVRNGVKDALVRLTSGYDRPVRIDWANLSVDEQHALVDLAREADTPDGLRLASLPARKLRRLETLAEKAAAQPGAFADFREQARAA